MSKTALRILPALLLSFSIGLAGCSAPTQPQVAYGETQLNGNNAAFAQLLQKLPARANEAYIDELRQFIESVSDSALRRKASYILGRLLANRGTNEDLREAVGRFDEAAKHPPLAERAQLHIAEAGMVLGDEKTVRSALESVMTLSSFPQTKHAAQYALAQSYLRGNEPEKAKEQFQQLKQYAAKTNYGLGATYYLATLDWQAGKKAEALAAFKQYLKASPDGRFAGDIVAQLSSLAQTDPASFTPSAQEHALFAEVYFNQGDYSKALKEWQSSGGNANWYKAALAQRRLGRTAEAKSALASGIASHPKDAMVVTAANVLCKLLTRQEAFQLWSDIYKRSPQAADAALYNMAIRSAPATAAGYYRQVIEQFPTSAYAPESAWWVAWHQIQSGNGAAAQTLLQNATQKYEKARAGARFAYWLGKVQERSGQKEQAKLAYRKTISEYPWHYYAHRAEARLQVLEGKADRGWRTYPGRKIPANEETIADWNWPEPPLQLAARHGETLAALTELRQWDECLELLPDRPKPPEAAEAASPGAPASSRHPVPPQAMASPQAQPGTQSHTDASETTAQERETGLLRAFYLAKMNQPLEAINAAGKALRGTPKPTEAWQLSFPLMYGKTVARESAAKGLDPLLVQALIREESRYNVHAVSSSNALGLMQLMPGTAYGVAKRLGVKLSGKQDIHKPENNIRLGIDYLSYVLNRANGNALFAVASYNGGPNAVAKWAQNLPSDMDVFVENIPFTETRDYVRKVFGSYWNYEKVYKQLPAVASGQNQPSVLPQQARESDIVGPAF